MSHQDELIKLMMKSYITGVEDAKQEAIKALEKTVAVAVAAEREACLKIIDRYEIPVGNSSAGEIACEMTYGALKDIHDEITARGTT